MSIFWKEWTIMKQKITILTTKCLWGKGNFGIPTIVCIFGCSVDLISKSWQNSLKITTSMHCSFKWRRCNEGRAKHSKYVIRYHGAQHNERICYTLSSAVILSVGFFSIAIAMLSVITLSVVILNVARLSVVAPTELLKFKAS